MKILLMKLMHASIKKKNKDPQQQSSLWNISFGTSIKRGWFSLPTKPYNTATTNAPTAYQSNNAAASPANSVSRTYCTRSSLRTVTPTEAHPQAEDDFSSAVPIVPRPPVAHSGGNKRIAPDARVKHAAGLKNPPESTPSASLLERTAHVAVRTQLRLPPQRDCAK